MRFIIQVRIEHSDPEVVDGHVVDVAAFEREGLSMGTLGLSIADAKTLLAGIQDTVIAEQCAAALASARVVVIVGAGSRTTIAPADCSQPLRASRRGFAALVDVSV